MVIRSLLDILLEDGGLPGMLSIKHTFGRKRPDKVGLRVIRSTPKDFDMSFGWDAGGYLSFARRQLAIS